MWILSVNAQSPIITAERVIKKEVNEEKFCSIRIRYPNGNRSI